MSKLRGGAKDRVTSALCVKDKILTIDLPHQLRAKFDCLFKIVFRLAV